jgi:hypothetical protein
VLYIAIVGVRLKVTTSFFYKGITADRVAITVVTTQKLKPHG